MTRPDWKAEATARLDRVIEQGDDYGDIANMTNDELRDVLAVAADRIRSQARQIEMHLSDAHYYASRLRTSGIDPNAGLA